MKDAKVILLGTKDLLYLLKRKRLPKELPIERHLKSHPYPSYSVTIQPDEL